MPAAAPAGEDWVVVGSKGKPRRPKTPSSTAAGAAAQPSPAGSSQQGTPARAHYPPCPAYPSSFDAPLRDWAAESPPTQPYRRPSKGPQTDAMRLAAQLHTLQLNRYEHGKTGMLIKHAAGASVYAVTGCMRWHGTLRRARAAINMHPVLNTNCFAVWSPHSRCTAAAPTDTTCKARQSAASCSVLCLWRQNGYSLLRTSSSKHQIKWMDSRTKVSPHHRLQRQLLANGLMCQTG